MRKARITSSTDKYYDQGRCTPLGVASEVPVSFCNLILRQPRISQGSFTRLGKTNDMSLSDGSTGYDFFSFDDLRAQLLA